MRALKLFVAHPSGPGALPLTSTLPDMRTDTKSYVKVQTLYKEQARVENVSVTLQHGRVVLNVNTSPRPIYAGPLQEDP